MRSRKLKLAYKKFAEAWCKHHHKRFHKTASFQPLSASFGLTMQCTKCGCYTVKEE